MFETKEVTREDALEMIREKLDSASDYELQEALFALVGEKKHTTYIVSGE
jgi:hypothetical protein